MTAIILAAGKGERLKPLTNQTPKPLITVAGKTLLQRNIDCLDQSGIKKIIVNGSRMGDQIESFLQNHKQSNLSFDYIHEGEEPMGTAGAIFNIIEKGLINDNHFWVINYFYPGRRVDVVHSPVGMEFLYPHGMPYNFSFLSCC